MDLIKDLRAQKKEIQKQISARAQLRQYLMSSKKNKSKAIAQLEYGLLLNWQKDADYETERLKPDTPIEIELWKYTEKNSKFKKIYES